MSYFSALAPERGDFESGHQGSTLFSFNRQSTLSETQGIQQSGKYYNRVWDDSFHPSLTTMVPAATDYFINCHFISLSAFRAIYGVWVNVWIAVIAVCIRFIFRHRIKRALLSGRRRINLWRVSPPVTTSELFEFRHVLIRALMLRHYFFVFASVFCVVVALVSAASTVISNYSVVANPAIIDVVVNGQNVTHHHNSMKGAVIEIANRVRALDLADAPLDELLDFAPNDNVHWVYRANQWNNTWKGKCTFTKYDDVDLVVYPTNSSKYQDEVPLLGNYIPSWATLNKTNQGTSYAGLYSSDTNETGSWANMIVTYFFGLAPDNDITFPAKTANISIVNFLAHEIGRYAGDEYVETAFKSDVHVAECGFVNSLPDGTEYQANAAGGSYTQAVEGIVGVYIRQVVMNSTAQLPIIQPTAAQMLRYWQAYLSLKDSQYPRPDVRTLSAVREVVQLRLSSLLITVGSFLLAVITACVAKYHEMGDKTNQIHLPSSQLDWMVQSAREHANTKPETRTTRSRIKSLTEFAIRNQETFYIVSSNMDPCVSIGTRPAAFESDATLLLALQSPTKEGEFDAWSGYSEVYSLNSQGS